MLGGTQPFQSQLPPGGIGATPVRFPGGVLAPQFPPGPQTLQFPLTGGPPKHQSANLPFTGLGTAGTGAGHRGAPFVGVVSDSGHRLLGTAPLHSSTPLAPSDHTSKPLPLQSQLLLKAQGSGPTGHGVSGVSSSNLPKHTITSQSGPPHPQPQYVAPQVPPTQQKEAPQMPLPATQSPMSSRPLPRYIPPQKPHLPQQPPQQVPSTQSPGVRHHAPPTQPKVSWTVLKSVRCLQV